MSQPWEATHGVDAALAARLVHGAFPDLADRAPSHVGSGWDNDVWRFGELAFRFPRRPEALPLLAVEAAVLPRLAPLLPLPIPAPTRFGAPTDAFPHPWHGGPFLPGTTADRVDPARLAGLAAPLGAFLRALHAIEAPGIPDDTLKSFPERRLAKTLQRLPGLVGTAWEPEIGRIEGALRAPLPPAPPWTTCHGDLYLRHLLVDDAGLCGVIDWGDLRRGNPGMDLSVAVAALPAEAEEAFWEAYGQRSAALRAWAAFYALHYGVLLTAYGQAVGDAPIRAAGERALSRSLGP